MIEFQYFNGCPNSTETLANLKKLVNHGFIDEEELHIIEVPDVESAERLNFQGSPTILYNGYDIYTKAVPQSYSFSCRVYKIGGKHTGILSKDYIRTQLELLRG
ncbi:MAG: thioredoxin family protein [Spirochaetia bacterium]|nr:thioredoxin family protein [Spirochaetia bacterium]